MLSNMLVAGNNNTDVRFESFNGKAAVMSTEVAKSFGKKHQHILRDIVHIRSQVPEIFFETNFGQSFREVETGNGSTRKMPLYLLTRDAFSLLVMGFTGKTAMLWKLKYIEAFNSLEAIALEKAKEAGRAEALSLPMLEAERKKGYLAGLAEGKKLAKKQDRLYVLERLICYARARLSSAEMGRCLGISANAVQKRIASFKKKGYWPKDIVPVQATLPGVE